MILKSWSPVKMVDELDLLISGVVQFGSGKNNA